MTTEHPILFTRPMVRATLAGIKTQTRRPIKRPLRHPGWTGYSYFASDGGIAIENGPDYPDADDDVVRCPYGVPGHRLWGRETYARVDGGFVYRADVPSLHEERMVVRLARKHGTKVTPWIPSIHMPRVAARLVLDIVSIRCQQLQDISEADALAEGVTKVGKRWEVEGIVATPDGARDAYKSLWEYIHGPGSWNANPWLWVIEYKRFAA